MFERFVSGRRPSWSRRVVLLASLGLHGAAALALLVMSFFHVSEIAPPALAVVFVSAPPPPPGGGETAAAPKPAHPKHARVQPTRAVVQPTTTPPPAQNDPLDSNDIPGDDGNDNGGDDGGPGGPGGGPGVPGGTGKGPLASTAPPRPVNVPPHKLDAERISGDDPHLPYPVIKAHAGERGLTFMARMCVDQAGRVSQVNVVQGLSGADANIIGTLRGWRYKPQPIPVCFMANFVFDVDLMR